MTTTAISRRTLAALLVSFAIAAPAHADGGGCPVVVKNAIDKAFPKASITRCKAERERGHDQFEVKLAKADGNNVEVDVTLDGKILQIEEKIAVGKVPASVMKAFAQRYPKAKLDAAEKQTPSGGDPIYELGFASDKGRAEASFKADGTFIGEE
jgi:hypothetical protein